MKLYIARHGQTDYNRQGRYAGSTDIPLNSEGIKQAQALAQKLASLPVDIIISSPLMRARQTAEIIHNNFLQTPLIIMGEFAERNMGIYENLTREEAQARYPVLYAAQCTRQIDGAPAGGETIREFDKRVGAGLSRLKLLYPDKNILIICHGYTARIINRQLKMLPFEGRDGFSSDIMNAFDLGNCEAAEYEI